MQIFLSIQFSLGFSRPWLPAFIYRAQLPRGLLQGVLSRVLAPVRREFCVHLVRLRVVSEQYACSCSLAEGADPSDIQQSVGRTPTSSAPTCTFQAGQPSHFPVRVLTGRFFLFWISRIVCITFKRINFSKILQHWILQNVQISTGGTTLPCCRAAVPDVETGALYTGLVRLLKLLLILYVIPRKCSRRCSRRDHYIMITMLCV